jgi:hypothetical protein
MRLGSFGVPVLAGFLVAAFAAGCGGGESSGDTFTGAKIGVAVRYPTIWQLTTYNNTFVPDPALCFELAPKVGAGVDVKVVEYLPPYLNPRYLSTYPRRPRRFSLDSLQPSDDDWSPGKLLSFREHRRVFFVGVVLPAKAPRATRRTIEAILDSLKVTAGRSCRPTGGVGAPGTP